MFPVLCWVLSATLQCLLLKVHSQPLWQCCFLPTPLHPSQFTPQFSIRPFQTINAYFFLFLFSVHSGYNFLLDAFIFTALPWFVMILSVTLNLSHLPNLNVNLSDWDMLYIHITASAQEEAHPVHPYWVADLYNHTKGVGTSGLHIPSMVRNQEIKPATLRQWTKKPFDIKDSLSKSSGTIGTESTGAKSILLTPGIPEPGPVLGHGQCSINGTNGRMKIAFHIWYHVEVFLKKYLGIDFIVCQYFPLKLSLYCYIIKSIFIFTIKFKYRILSQHGKSSTLWSQFIFITLFLPPPPASSNLYSLPQVN